MDIELFWKWLNCTRQSTSGSDSFYADNMGKFCTPAICNYIFSLCRKLKTPDDVPFVAISLLDRFICSEMQILAKANLDTNPLQLRRALLHKKKTFILHVYSVVQLTTKSVDRRKILKASALVKILKKISFTTDLKDIVNSELYVLRALQDDFCCFNLLTPTEFLLAVHNVYSPHAEFDVLCDVLYMISANLPCLFGNIRLIFRHKLQQHEYVRIISACAVVFTALTAHSSVLRLTEMLAPLLNCSVNEILAVTLFMFELV